MSKGREEFTGCGDKDVGSEKNVEEKMSRNTFLW